MIMHPLHPSLTGMNAHPVSAQASKQAGTIAQEPVCGPENTTPAGVSEDQFTACCVGEAESTEHVHPWGLPVEGATGCTLQVAYTAGICPDAFVFKKTEILAVFPRPGRSILTWHLPAPDEIQQSALHRAKMHWPILRRQRQAAAGMSCKWQPPCQRQQRAIRSMQPGPQALWPKHSRRRGFERGKRRRRSKRCQIHLPRPCCRFRSPFKETLKPLSRDCWAHHLPLGLP